MKIEPSHQFTFDPTHSSDGDFEMLACPLCGGNWVHIDDAHFGGRPSEDGEFVNVTVDSDGAVKEHVMDADMAKPTLTMRRHYLTVLGWCETCGGRFGYAFVQHKGQTKVQLIRPRWLSVTQ